MKWPKFNFHCVISAFSAFLRLSRAGILSPQRRRGRRDCAEMRQIIIVVITVLTFSIVASAQKKSSCIECHLHLDDPRLNAPAKLFDTDIHRSRGLSCNDCHGRDPNDDSKEGAKDVRKGYLGKPKKLDIPAYCGKCHSDANLMKKFNPSLRVDQEREYYTSVHGKLLKTGETRVATCIDRKSVV